MSLDAARLAELDAFLLALNRASGEVILPLFRAEHGMVDKGKHGFDPVTEADKEAFDRAFGSAAADARSSLVSND